ncbi:hypothetical protein HDU98_004030, partial [Podochytrium sp. JEL0797]
MKLTRKAPLSFSFVPATSATPTHESSSSGVEPLQSPPLLSPASSSCKVNPTGSFSMASMSEALPSLEAGLRYDVHIAYSKHDSTTALQIILQLRKRGIFVSTSLTDPDEADGDPESDPLNESAVFAVILSQSSEADISLKSDVQFAFSVGKPAVGVVVGGTPEDEVSALGFGWVAVAAKGCGLGTVCWLNGESMEFREGAIDSLAKKISTAATKVPGAPLFRATREEALIEGDEAGDVAYALRPTTRKPRLSILR